MRKAAVVAVGVLLASLTACGNGLKSVDSSGVPVGGDELADVGGLASITSADGVPYAYASIDGAPIAARFDVGTSRWIALAAPPEVTGGRLAAYQGSGLSLVLLGVRCRDDACEGSDPVVAWLDGIKDDEWSVAEIPMDLGSPDAASYEHLGTSSTGSYFIVESKAFRLHEGIVEPVVGLDALAPAVSCQTGPDTLLVAGTRFGDVDSGSAERELRLATADLSLGEKSVWKIGANLGPLEESLDAPAPRCAGDALVVFWPDRIDSYETADGPSSPIELPAGYRRPLGGMLPLPDGLAAQLPDNHYLVLHGQNAVVTSPSPTDGGPPPVSTLVDVDGIPWLYAATNESATFGPLPG